MREPLIDSSRELRIHLRAWDEGQVQLCRSLLSVAPYVADLTPVIEGLLKRLRESQLPTAPEQPVTPPASPASTPYRTTTNDR